MQAEERPSKLRKLSHDPDNKPDMLGGDEVAASAAGHLNGNDGSKVSTDDFKTPSLSSMDVKTISNEAANAKDIAVQNPELPVPLSKNQLKKIKRDQQWEAGREQRKALRKQKDKDRKERKRKARELAAVEAADPEGASGTSKPNQSSLKSAPLRKHIRPTLLPITFLLDCQFNDLMKSDELISLGQQLTRCYSEIHHAPFKARMVVSSWGGSLKERFDNVLCKAHENWKGVHFTSKQFLEAARDADAQMRGPQGGRLAGAFANYSQASGGDHVTDITTEQHNDQMEQSKPQSLPGEIVYLTADSPNTISHLSPYSTYIIGALVDKNRHKGICYKIARDAGADNDDQVETGVGVFRTAKLPIGEYMSMQSRAVLTTNHVCEIMSRWLECGDWGEAFSRVLPKRKGATLKRGSGNGREADDHDESSELKDDKSGDIDEDVVASDPSEVTESQT